MCQFYFATFPPSLTCIYIHTYTTPRFLGSSTHLCHEIIFVHLPTWRIFCLTFFVIYYPHKLWRCYGLVFQDFDEYCLISSGELESAACIDYLLCIYRTKIYKYPDAMLALLVSRLSVRNTYYTHFLMDKLTSWALHLVLYLELKFLVIFRYF